MINNVLKHHLKTQYGEEQVFVVPYNYTINIPNGFNVLDTRAKDLIRSYESTGIFMKRYDAEYNTSVQQIIPYTLIFSQYKSDKIYVAKRLAGDNRLIDTYSLGFGGHINPEDKPHCITNAAIRELNEEVDIKYPTRKVKPKLVGTARDLVSETKEHLGFIFAVKASGVKIREKDKLKGKWLDIFELVDKYYFFESWSRFIIDELFSFCKNESTTCIGDRFFQSN